MPKCTLKTIYGTVDESFYWSSWSCQCWCRRGQHYPCFNWDGLSSCYGTLLFPMGGHILVSFILPSLALRLCWLQFLVWQDEKMMNPKCRFQGLFYRRKKDASNPDLFRAVDLSNDSKFGNKALMCYRRRRSISSCNTSSSRSLVAWVCFDGFFFFFVLFLLLVSVICTDFVFWYRVELRSLWSLVHF